MYSKNTLTKMVMGVLLLSTLYFTSCGSDDGPSAQTQQLQKLSATWLLDQVTNDNQDVTSQFTGFTLTINDDENYTTQNGGNPWPSTGTFVLTSDLSLLVRSDNVEISIDELTQNSLILSFNYSSVSVSRVNGITGNFTFSLTK